MARRWGHARLPQFQLVWSLRAPPTLFRPEGTKGETKWGNATGLARARGPGLVTWRPPRATRSKDTFCAALPDDTTLSRPPLSSLHLEAAVQNGKHYCNRHSGSTAGNEAEN